MHLTQARLSVSPHTKGTTNTETSVAPVDRGQLLRQKSQKILRLRPGERITDRQAGRQAGEVYSGIRQGNGANNASGREGTKRVLVRTSMPTQARNGARGTPSLVTLPRTNIVKNGTSWTPPPLTLHRQPIYPTTRIPANQHAFQGKR